MTELSGANDYMIEEREGRNAHEGVRDRGISDGHGKKVIIFFFSLAPGATVLPRDAREHGER